MRRRFLIPLFLLVILLTQGRFAIAQSRQKVKLLDVFRSAIFDQVEDSTLVIQHSIVSIKEMRKTTVGTVQITDARSLPERLQAAFGKIPQDSTGKIIFRNSIIFSNCEFPDGFYADSVNIDQLSFEESDLREFSIDKSVIDDLSINASRVHKVQIRRTKFYSLDFAANTLDDSGYFGKKIELVLFGVRSLGAFSIQSLNAATDLYLERSSFSSQEAQAELQIGTSDGSADTEQYHSLTIISSEFEKSIPRVYLRNRYASVEIINSGFACPLDFESTLVSEKIHLAKNQFAGPVFLNNVKIQGELDCKWNQFEGRKLGVVQISRSKKYGPGSVSYRSTDYVPAKAQDFGQQENYDELVSVYQLLLGSYRLRGDLESANACFAEMKDLQVDRLAYLYSQKPSFTTYFRWKLALLMKFYTNHGTDPARAIVVSIEVVLLFALIYFFFPSDWDVTSKSQMMQHVKSLTAKERKGFSGTLIRLLWGLTVSMINAFTLSLNAFTTLGFGNIPTYGLARYLCVLEGFIGWFLLSIFTVALINQVLG